mmetsp:Transcript_114241/g.363112  ORF Transcript_114241/g.363112 Transcript_114241/m.363112 type:complete len:372 (-) Transcript_114241:907-2022(-)
MTWPCRRPRIFQTARPARGPWRAQQPLRTSQCRPRRACMPRPLEEPLAAPAVLLQHPASQTPPQEARAPARQGPVPRTWRIQPCSRKPPRMVAADAASFLTSKLQLGQCETLRQAHASAAAPVPAPVAPVAPDAPSAPAAQAAPAAPATPSGALASAVASAAATAAATARETAATPAVAPAVAPAAPSAAAVPAAPAAPVFPAVPALPSATAAPRVLAASSPPAVLSEPAAPAAPAAPALPAAPAAPAPALPAVPALPAAQAAPAVHAVPGSASADAAVVANAGNAAFAETAPSGACARSWHAPGRPANAASTGHPPATGLGLGPSLGLPAPHLSTSALPVLPGIQPQPWLLPWRLRPQPWRLRARPLPVP